ncbi:MAG: Ig-like domain repeat protein, partial [Eubacterium sp.]|nr:Ig-like domain repeat protein [Eubacterium sp.]
MKKSLSFLLSLLMVISSLFAVPFTAKAETPTITSAICPMEEYRVLQTNANTANASTVWYGGSAWRVIGYNGAGVASENITATLLASGNMGLTYFDDGRNGITNKYNGSALKSRIDDITAGLSAAEQGAIVKRTLVKGGYDGNNTDCIAGDEDLDNQLLWPLSTREAYTLNTTLRQADPDNPNLASRHWWLRSPGDSSSLASSVFADGSINTYGEYVYKEDDINCEYGVRPAFRLNLPSVLFVSAAEGGKQSAEDGTLAPVGDYSGSEWKTTLLDDGSEDSVGDGHKNFKAEFIGTDGDPWKFKIKYSGAEVGENEYISAVIEGYEKDDVSCSNWKTLYYGRLCKAKADPTEPGAEPNTITLDLTGMPLNDNPGSGYKILSVFNEQYNGDKKTDYASAPQTIKCPTSMKLEAQNVSEGEYAIITAKLPQCSTGKVKFTVNGVTYDVEIKDGTAELTVAGLAAGTYDVEAVYEGDDSFVGCSAETSFSVLSNEIPASTLQQGDTFEMGMYPQTKVTDDATITALNAIDCTMANYGYMQNSDEYKHTFDPVDMTYADIRYNGEVYRKVTINEYRPKTTEDASSASDTYQDENGYTLGNTYYFKWEPIVWQVLKKEGDGVYVMSKTLIDSQAHNNYYEDTKLKTRSIIKWLNDSFYNAAFSRNEKTNFVIDRIGSSSSPNGEYPDGDSIMEPIYLLSWDDVDRSAYGFYDNQSRRAKGTDYAKCQGLKDVYYSVWWLRNHGNSSCSGCGIDTDGKCVSGYYTAQTTIGVRPAFKLSLDATVGIADAVDCRVTGNHTWVDGDIITAPTCKTAGERNVSCSVCGAEKTEPVAINPDAHDFSNNAQFCRNGCGKESSEYISAKASDLTTGDMFTMGMYPQSRVTDSDLISALEAIDCTTHSYNYVKYAKNTTHTFEEVDMKYADIVYNGNVYRKVIISEYRPRYNSSAAGTNTLMTYQDDNGYTLGTYYFKWEPLIWSVLANESDGVYVMSKSLIDSQEYNIYEENSAWASSKLRAWLNDSFLNTAFSESEKGNIVLYTHSNDKQDDVNTDMGETTDMLWVPSLGDLLNADYGFSSVPNQADIARCAESTDYAKSQGAYDPSSSSYNAWWLRTINYDAKYSNASERGIIRRIFTDISAVCVRPAFKLNLNATVSKSASPICRAQGHTFGDWTSADGVNHKHTCSVCSYTETVAHNWKTEWSTDGTKHWHECSVCGAKTGENEHSFRPWSKLDSTNHTRE